MKIKEQKAKNTINGILESCSIPENQPFRHLQRRERIYLYFGKISLSICLAISQVWLLCLGRGCPVVTYSVNYSGGH